MSEKLSDHQPSMTLSLEQKMAERRLDMLLKQTTMTGFFSVLFASILTFIMRDSMYYTNMLYWLGANFAMVLTRETIIYPRLRIKRVQDLINPKLIYATIAGFWIFSGVLWGCAGYFFLPAANEPELMITFLSVMVGITSGNIISFSPAVWVGFSFIIPTITGFAIRLYQYENMILFYCILFYFLYLSIAIFRISKVVINTISLDLKNQQLLLQVTEEKQRAEAEKTKAERANQSKTEFMMSASHDLRQPLNSLGLFLFGLKQKIQSGASDSLQLLEKVEQAHRSLSFMFSRMLEVSSVETGKVIPKASHVNVSKIIASIIDEYSQQCQSKDIKISHVPLHTHLYTDELLLTRIVRNLLDNAVKYTENGHIEVSEVLTEGGLQLCIRDTGIGIPLHELSKIFDEYHQVGNKKRDIRQGLGLGLFITYKLCQLLNFRIEIDSTLGKGSCFCINVPIEQANLPTTNHTPESVLTPLTDLHVLVIDDDPDINSGMSLILEQWHCKVSTAFDLKSSLLSARHSEPDIVLCDYRLEESITGLVVLKHLEVALGKTLPAIIITGEHFSKGQIEKELSDYRVLQKPVIPKALHQAILEELAKPDTPENI